MLWAVSGLSGKSAPVSQLDGSVWGEVSRCLCLPQEGHWKGSWAWLPLRMALQLAAAAGGDFLPDPGGPAGAPGWGVRGICSGCIYLHFPAGE